MQRRTRIIIALLVSAWCFAVGFGTHLLLRYSVRPGAEAAVPSRWPAASRLVATHARMAVIFLHPECACSRQSVDTLAEVFAVPRSGLETELHVLFARPRGWSTERVKESLWRRASEIPGARLMIDETGEESARFGATTSGHAFLYDAGGKLVFSGGLTPARGHAGDSPGSASLEAFLDGNPVPFAAWKVFGCSLKEAELALRGRGGAGG